MNFIPHDDAQWQCSKAVVKGSACSAYLKKEKCSVPCLDKFTEVAQARLLGIRDVLDEDENGVHNRLLVLKAAILPQHIGQEIHQRPVPVASSNGPASVGVKA